MFLVVVTQRSGDTAPDDHFTCRILISHEVNLELLQRRLEVGADNLVDRSDKFEHVVRQRLLPDWTRTQFRGIKMFGFGHGFLVGFESRFSKPDNETTDRNLWMALTVADGGVEIVIRKGGIQDGVSDDTRQVLAELNRLDVLGTRAFWTPAFRVRHLLAFLQVVKTATFYAR